MTISDNKNYANPVYGLVRRVFTVPQTKDDAATTGTLAESFFNVPTRSQLVKFGIMSAASDVVTSTNTVFELRTRSGTKIATFLTSAHVTLGSGDATGAAPETATQLRPNEGYRVTVGTAAGLSGSVYYFCDIKEAYRSS